MIINKVQSFPGYSIAKKILAKLKTLTNSTFVRYVGSALITGIPLMATYQPDDAIPQSSQNLVFQGMALNFMPLIGRALVIKEYVNLSEFEKKPNLNAEEVERVKSGIIHTFGTLRKNISSSKSTGISDLIKMMIPDLEKELLNIIETEKVNAAAATEIILASYLHLKDSEDKSQKNIYTEIEKMLIKILNIKHGFAKDIEEEIKEKGLDNVVIVAHDLSIFEEPLIFNQKISAFLREKGGKRDHISVVLLGEEETSFIGVKNLVRNVFDGNIIIIYPLENKIIVRPDAQTLEKYKVKIEAVREIWEYLKKERNEPSVSLDGEKIFFLKNVISLDEIHNPLILDEKRADELKYFGYCNVGLIRTENLFRFDQNGEPRKSHPSINEQQKYYQEMVKRAQERKVTFRTLDIDPEDKALPYLNITEPIDLSKFLDGSYRDLQMIFTEQIKALLMTEGQFRVMFPRIRYIKDYDAAINFVEKIKKELENEGKFVNDEIEFGAMVELESFVNDLSLILNEHETDPEKSTRKLLEDLVRSGKLKFLSLGTNDLTKDTLFVSRKSTEASIEGEYDELDPRVLKNIEISKMVAEKLNIEISVCGDMGNNVPELLMLLAIGIRKISISPAFIDIARRIVRSIEVSSLKEILWGIKGNEIRKGFKSDLSFNWEIQSTEEIRKFIAHSLNNIIRSGKWVGLEPIRCLITLTPKDE